MARQKCMDIRLGGAHLICEHTERKGKTSPFRDCFEVYDVYQSTSGKHKKKLAVFDDFMGVIFFVKDFYVAGANIMRKDELMQWAKLMR